MTEWEVQPPGGHCYWDGRHFNLYVRRNLNPTNWLYLNSMRVFSSTLEFCTFELCGICGIFRKRPCLVTDVTEAPTPKADSWHKIIDSSKIDVLEISIMSNSVIPQVLNHSPAIWTLKRYDV